MKNNYKQTIWYSLWFSIIEIMIWVFIFSLWIISIFAIIIATINVNTYNKNHIIASNLAREQLELVRNIRDTNYIRIQRYNQLDQKITNYNKVLESHSSYDEEKLIQIWQKYKIENDFSDTAPFSINMKKFENIFKEWKENLNSDEMEYYRLCIDNDKKYIYCNGSTRLKPTRFYKYIDITQVSTKDDDTDIVINNAIKVKSKVIWYIKWYHEYEINTVIADRKRL